MATYKDAFKEALKYFNGDTMAAEVFLGKYALTNPDGNILETTPRAMHKRLAKELARIEKNYPNPMSEAKIFGLLDNFGQVILQGSPMAGIGNPWQIMTLSNCYTLESPYDSYGGILKTDQEQAQLMKRRAGVGFDISRIRPRGEHTANAAKTTDGVGVFMERFSNTCKEVAQGGRRGALMQSISIHHPEIETFIEIKRDRSKVTNANISIRLSDEFMRAVKEGTDVQLRWPVDSRDPEIVRLTDAKALWDKIIDSAHECAEPGLLFWDTCTTYTPSDAYSSKGFSSVSVNPCAEIILSKNDSCRLTVVNAYSFVENAFKDDAWFNFKKFTKVAFEAQRIMDDIIDLELECIDRIIDKIKADKEPAAVKAIELGLWKNIKTTCEKGRRTGLGVTGIGDTVASLGITYGSPGSIDLVGEIYKNLALGSYRSSVQLASERGTFPIYNHELEKNHPMIQRIMAEDPKLAADYEKYGRRNIANTTTAPGGSISIEAQVSSGIEPTYRLEYTRRRKINSGDKAAKVDFVDDEGVEWQEYSVKHHAFNRWQEVTGKKDPKDSPFHKATATEIDWEASVDLQAAAQHWVDHAISKTCNLPEDVTKDVVSNVYMRAWEKKCKGFTVYREGSRTGVLVSKKFNINNAPKRPDDLECDIYHMTVRGEKWNMFIGLFDDKPYEIFAGLAEYVSIPRSRTKGTIKKNGKYNVHIGEGDNEIVIKDLARVFENKTESAFTRTLSLALRHGAPIQYIVEQLEKGADKESDMFSLSKGLMRCLKTYIKDGTKPSLKECKQCGSEDLAYMEGCISCNSCAWSKCS